MVLSERSQADFDSVSPQSAGDCWDAGRDDDYYRYLHELGFGSPALVPRGVLDAVSENEDLSSSTSSISSTRSSADKN